MVDEQRARVYCLVDGFNLYHSLDWYVAGKTKEENLRYRRYKWLSLWKLAQNLADPNEEVVGVEYFTSVPTWDVGKQTRHRIYIRAQEAEGVLVTKGQFRDKDVICKATCKFQFPIQVEKKTDVNIAIKLLDLAYQNAFDIAFLVSADTDLIPAIDMVRKRFPKKQVISVLPIGKKTDNSEIRNTCNTVRKMTEKHLLESQMPETVVDPKDKVRVLRPIQYLPIETNPS